MESVEEAARNASATKVLEIDLSVGVMTEAMEDALRFAFEALSEGTMCEGADFKINMIQPVSVCLECGNEFEHDRYHVTCPQCESGFTQLIAGKEMQIDSIEVNIPDEDDSVEGSQLQSEER